MIICPPGIKRDNFTDLIFRFLGLPAHNANWPPQYQTWQLYRSDFQIFRSTCSHCWLTLPVSNLTTLQVWFSDFQVYLLTLLTDPPYVSLAVPVHCLCKGITKDLLWTAINRYILYIEREREYWTVRFPFIETKELWSKS